MEGSEVLGDGTYSLCMKCYALDSKQEYAVKIVKLDHDSSQEIEALEKCQGHKNVVKLIEKISDKKFTYIVCELLTGGELFNRIRHYGCLTEPLARLYFNQIVDVVSFMHSKSIVHRDLKPENFVFVNNSQESLLKLLDFGFACHETSEETPPCFTLDYAAPESLTKGETKFSRDLWALGVILYTMLCGNTPFKPTNKDQDERNFRIQIMENIRKGSYNVGYDRWNHISPEAKDLIANLLKINESERLSLDELKKHSWMKDTTVEHTSNKILQRAESSETVINDDTLGDELEDIDDEEEEYDQSILKDENNDSLIKIPIENREETRSNNDDSSSGIVMSDRNDGSSVSSHHEELDECEKKTSEIQEYIVEQQEEPEDLSMKDIPSRISTDNKIDVAETNVKELIKDTLDENEMPIVIKNDENESLSDNVNIENIDGENKKKKPTRNTTRNRNKVNNSKNSKNQDLIPKLTRSKRNARKKTDNESLTNQDVTGDQPITTTAIKSDISKNFKKEKLSPKVLGSKYFFSAFFRSEGR